ncbi:4Fe-4S ferredoxin, partial [Candidatus Bipolaricaulota bacterium]|nr:4Fe-4S ferredoxin [Candidatus Bipolaricaulota bacterium]
MLRRSSREFWKAGRKTAGYSFSDFLHGYVYLRWPYAYIGIAKGDLRVPAVLKPFVGVMAWLFLRSAVRLDLVEGKREFADRYHAKVVPTEAAVQLVTLEQPIELRDLEKIIPYSTAKDILLSEPDHIVALDCPCRAEVENPCLPLDVCLIIGEPFANFVSDHHPTQSRRISQ